MKNLKSIILLGSFLLGMGGFYKISAQSISTHYFGENAWMPDTIGNASACQEPPCILYGKLHKHWGNVKASKAAIVRFGGIAADNNMPTNYQFIRMIDSIRMHGMEPIIQVPFANYRYTAQQAADIVKYINVTRGKNIKYWIIGNEPDLGYSYTTASQIAAYFKPFASAMKSIDPNILIIGPEIASFNKGIIDGLTNTGGPDDITGKDANGRYYLDVISFHTYPFNGSQNRSQVISKLMSPNSLDANLNYLNARVAACNTFHGRTGSATLKTAITEANINWQNNSADNLNGVGANSFIGGQFVAEMMGIGMKNGLDFINIWSVIEGNTTATNIGFVDPSTNNKKPLYYHFKLMAENFKGTYVASSTSHPNVKSIACQSGQQTAVFVLNQDLATNYNASIALSNAAIAGSDPLKINVNANIPVTYTISVPNQSSVLFVFNAAGTLIKKYEYSLSTHASANLPPTYTNYLATDVASAAGIGLNPSFDIDVFPNPTNGVFTIKLSRPNSEEKNFEIELFNLIGQLVYHKNSVFENGVQDVELTQHNMAQGAYIVRVREGDHVTTRKIVVNK